MHWTCRIVDGKIKYYFVSFDITPTKEINEYLKSPIIPSTFQIQQFNEKNCGEWGIYVVRRLN